ncbi:hypothetical protein MMC13_008272 [Lambiella insularis]|nr:hypothetical protein [Lambiella insularis]
MSVAERRRQDVEASLNNLYLSSSSHKPSKPVPKPQSTVTPNSWDEDLSSDTESEISPRPYCNDFPSAPPPTPITPTSNAARGGWAQFENPYSPGIGRSSDGDLSPMRGNFRPEKTTAVAGRMIAGALGVRAPKKSEEQRQYEKVVKEKEVRRREKEREGKRREEDEAVKAKAAIWDA